MKENLQNLGLFSAYVSTNNSNGTNGALTIVNDESENLQLYIDNEFIASGFGFPNSDSYIGMISYISSIGTDVENIKQGLEIFSGKTFSNTSLEYTYTNNIVGQKYNEYGMPYSYNYLDLTYNYESDLVSYSLDMKVQNNHNYIKSIQLTLDEDKDYYIDEDIKGTLDITFNNTSQEGLGNYKISYTCNGNTIETELQELQIQNGQNGSHSQIDIFIEAPNLIDKKSITVDLLHKYNNSGTNNDNYIIYSYIYKDILSWKDKLIYSSSTNYHSKYSVSNRYNLNDTNTSELTDTSSNVYRVFSDIINDYIDNTNNTFEFSYYGYNEDIKLEFENSEALYDYIFTKEELNPDIEFYFNTIKTKPWSQTKITLTTVNNSGQIYYIYQSPQKYVGKHNWIIKINKNQ